MSYGALFSTKLVAQGDYEAAVAKAGQEIAAQPDEPEAYFNRAQAHAGLQRHLEAVADYERALSLDASGSALDPAVVDDELFDALRLVALGHKANPGEAIAILERYRAILPQGRHIEDVAKWTAHFKGHETVWVRERA